MQTSNAKKTTVSIKTFGCQMNMYDTEVAEGLLLGHGYEIVPDLMGSKGDRYEPSSDIVLMNTCSVREHAEDRVFGRLGMLRKAKEKNPNLIVGLMGCMVEEHRESLFKRYPQIDLMVGTRNISQLPSLIAEVRSRRKQVAKIKHDGISIEYTDQILRQGKWHAWLPIMTGCNKVCTFCIVPITRGSEVSMPARDVYREASRLVDEGVTWLTLLGQNVNSYDGRATVVSSQDSRSGEETHTSIRFPELLERLATIEGLQRISFTTSHPHDATEELFQVIKRNPKISRRFHLPLQSGSDRILKRMKRLHSYTEYKRKIDRLRELVPDVSITSDIIVGFSGETADDHQATKHALEEIRFDGAYIYKYSVRPNTPASKLPDDVPIEIKEARNAELLGVQKGIAKENNQRYLTRSYEVFVEAPSTKDQSCLVGRTHSEKKVVFPGEKTLLGSMQKINFQSLRHDTFLGVIENLS